MIQLSSPFVWFRNKALHFGLFLIAIIFTFTNVHSQITVNFTAENENGCVPTIIQFQNQSNDNGNYTYLWDFGNGNTSTSKNPVSTYSTPGSYSIKLTVFDGEQSKTLTKENYINIYNPPSVHFTPDIPSDQCTPYQVPFNSEVTPTSDDYRYTWDFGDGVFSDAQNPIHTYEQPGIYNVTLIVEDFNGCTGKMTRENLITAKRPTATFGAETTRSCNGELSPQFKNESYGIGDLKYKWDFGDEQYSTEQAPSHTYTGAGNYDVKLTVTDDIGCSDSIEIDNFISITNTIASFTTKNDTVCPNVSVEFTNNSTNNRTNTWDFGDGTTSIEENPVHKFTKPGDYIIQLSVGNYECSDVTTTKIHVEDVNIDFDISDPFSCEVPVNITYTPKGSKMVSYSWDFGNGILSEQVNPTITYNSNQALQTNYTENYSTSLTVISEHGCVKKIQKNDVLTITIPQISIITDNPTSGCKPLDIQYSHNINYPTEFDQIKSTQWKIDDQDITTDPSFKRTFNDIGKYKIYLNVETDLGCAAQASKTISVGDVIELDFKVLDKNEFCASELVIFEETTVNPKSYDNITWDFGDGEQSLLGIPFHQYVDTGYMDVGLNVSFNGCASTVTKNNMVYIKGPVLDLTRITNCDSPYDAEFAIQLKNAESYTCVFGDGDSIVSSSETIHHVYNEKGLFPVRAYANNTENGCSYSKQYNIIIAAPEAAFDTTAYGPCSNTDIYFDPSKSIDANDFEHNQKMNKYLWDFGDGTSEFTSSQISHQYKNSGKYNVQLVISDINQCRDTITKEVEIYKPTSNFSSDYLEGCIPVKFKFTDLTTHELPINKWEWNFGDAQSSELQNPIHEYQNFGDYKVSLSVTNERGCRSTISLNNAISVANPDANFEVSDAASCINDTLKFYDTSLSNVNEFTWDFGDGNTSSLRNPEHSYQAPGNYDVTLTIIDDHGCTQEESKLAFVNIEEPPTAAFTSDQQESNCYPFPVLFTDESVYSDSGFQKWIFGDNQTGSSLKTPQHIYSKPGNYDVSLIAYSNNGCSDTIKKADFIKVGGPYAEIELADTACIHNNISFSLKNAQNISTIVWDFGDGNSSTDFTATHKYKQKGKIYPNLILKTNSNFSCNKIVSDSIYINMLAARFNFVDDIKKGCIPLNIAMNNTSEYASGYVWQTENGMSSTDNNASFTFASDGDFKVKLIASDNFGCKDTATSTITAFPLPTITTSGDTYICRGDNTALLATGGMMYQWNNQWNNDSTLVDSNTDNPIAAPSQDTHYTVTVTDTNNCINNASLKLTVQQVPTVDLVDTTIIIGETVKLNIAKDDIETYSWLDNGTISCTSCPDPTLFPLETTNYLISITDTSNCFNPEYQTTINVIKKYSVDVPTAFTPNGDNLNDIIHVRGWGIKELIYFRVFNRLGQMIFESTDINKGWNGDFKGKPQDSDTYNYVVKVATYEDKTLEKKGSLKLIR